MTNEELDCARATEAVRLRLLPGLWQHETVIAARLAREGWTPPVAVDPDIAEAKKMADDWIKGGLCFWHLALAAIKRGRALAAAEAKPGLVWKKWEGSTTRPSDAHGYVWVKNKQGTFVYFARDVAWSTVTHYAVITPPAEDVA